MPITAEIDERLVEEARRLGGYASESEAVNAALKEYVRRHTQLSALDLVGAVEYYPDYDYKDLRRKEVR